jgi:hypothetical protein
MAISKHSRAAGLAAMLGLTMLSRWLCRSHLLYDIDSVISRWRSAVSIPSFTSPTRRAIYSTCAWGAW